MNEPLPRRRIVVTGLGVVSAVGNGPEAFWEGLISGRSGIDRITAFDTSDYPCKIGAEVRDFDPCAWMDPKEARRNDRYTQFAVAAAKQGIRDAGIDLGAIDGDRCGVFVGSGIGGIITIETQARVLFERGPRKVSPFMIPSLIANIASGVVAIELGARGPNFSIVSACASSTHSIGESLKTLRAGEADIMIAGGAEAPITGLGYAGFCSMKAMSIRNEEPQRASRPFDRGRDGFVMGEGAGVLVLETLEHARARGARIYCELAGYGASCDAFHITQPDTAGRGLALAMRSALRSAGMTADEVDYINAHGTSTPYNDKFETAAIKQVYGEHARRLLVSSTKSMTGHLLGAAGAIEAAATVKAIASGIVPPTINLDTPDPECDLDYVPHKARSASVRAAMSNNLGFGGQNAALVFRRLD
ncbi:beta-ketoacyl-ACP synthase II [Opitutales bacterium ASA1]|uniref:beta-ketoacyl-ACP synthase II n=1 Tax=Congregicoccus parvus TaxID=3081749 RepID=UPI002B321720|nr:beta-ketoacyl-ACP synthase II [Opitutales bacterium ASA1]